MAETGRRHRRYLRGTSDLPVADEAAVTLEIFGNRVERITDVGVAGHSPAARRTRTARSVQCAHRRRWDGGRAAERGRGLVSKPVIAVPTSVGYGASFGGLAALLGMLNSCGSGVTVVNIDNGFGAAYAAAQINCLITQPRRDALPRVPDKLGTRGSASLRRIFPPAAALAALAQVEEKIPHALLVEREEQASASSTARLSSFPRCPHAAP